MDISEFIVDKGKEAGEDEKNEEIDEISLTPDLEAEEARKEELRLQAKKVRTSEFSRHNGRINLADTSYGQSKLYICSLDVVRVTSWS